MAAGVVFLVVFVPLSAANGLMRFGRVFGDNRWAVAAQSMGILSGMNLSTALLPLMFAISSAVLLANRVAWSFIERPVYALQRTRILEHRKVWATVGGALITRGLWPHVHALLSQLR
jgi:hypothetical protein